MIAQIHDTVKGEIFQTDDHQVEAYEHLMSHKRAALFLGMSLSKTVIVLSYLYDMHYKECAFTKTLVVAPDKVARLTWPNEIKQWEHLTGLRYSMITGTPKQRLKALAADAEVYIVTTDNIVWLNAQFIKKINGKYKGKLPFDSIVFDELDFFKSRESNRFKSMRRAVRTVEYRVGMTGTPAPNGYVDLWAQIMLLDDGLRLGDTFGKFLDKNFTTRGNGMIVYEYKPRPGAVKYIAAKIKDIALTMATEDYIDLPDMHIDDIEITFDKFDQEIYDELEREYTIDFIEGGEVTVKTPADLSNKLLQISSGAIYEDREDPTDARVWHQLNSIKIDALGKLLEEHSDETFIVVYQFRHEIDRIKEAFPYARELRKGKYLAEDFAEWNQGKIRLLLLHPASAGHGLNLQFGGRRMVWFTPTWNLGHWLQTTRRLLRRGVTRDIYMHRLIILKTRDAAVRKRIFSKDTDQNFLLNEIKLLRQKYGKARKK